MGPGYHPILSLPVRHILTEIIDVIGNSVFAAHCVSQKKKMMFSEDEEDGHTPESSCPIIRYSRCDVYIICLTAKSATNIGLAPISLILTINETAFTLD